MGGLISEAYREQNAVLHQHSDKFGAHGHRWAMRTVNVARQHACESILDYGCGKGTLRRVISSWDVKEYDPAIAGKHIAEPSDLVVCTDVLEHIEPDRLDDVLIHLHSVTKKRLLFCISTKLAKMHLLPDGRNPHLSFHDAFWWKDRLSGLFQITEWTVEKNACYGEASPIREMPQIQTLSALEESQRIEHMQINSRRVLRRLKDDNVTPHGRTAILVCAGPSLNMTLPLIDKETGDIFTVSVAHRVLIENNIIPFAHIDCDPREHKSRQIGRPHHGVKYWLASCVHPDYLDRLIDYNITLWHLHNGPETEKAFFDDPIFAPGEWLAIGGGSVGLRAISLLYSQGYRHFSVHGMDCSHLSGQRHATKHLGKIQPTMKVRCGDRWFDSSLSLIDYARQFCDDLRLWPDATFQMHGDGLLQHMVKINTTGEADERYLYGISTHYGDGPCLDRFSGLWHGYLWPD